MEWYYANEGQRQGPVTDEGLARLVAVGTVHGATLVWRAGMASWQPWREVAPTMTLPSVPATELAPVLGTPLTSPESVAEPEPTAPADAEAFWQSLKAHGYTTSVGHSLSRAWRLYSASFWPCLGVTLLAYLLIVVSANVPVVGLVTQFLVVPQLTAGLFWYFLRKVRDEPAEVSDLFVGFQRGFGQLALVNLIQFAILLPLMFIFIAIGVGVAALNDGLADGGGNPAMTAGMVAVIAALSVGAALLMFRFFLSHILVVDRGESALSAMKLSWRMMGLRYLTLLGLALLIALLCLAGMLALLIGVVFVLPLFPASFAYAYEDAVRSARGQPPLD